MTLKSLSLFETLNYGRNVDPDCEFYIKKDVDTLLSTYEKAMRELVEANRLYFSEPPQKVYAWNRVNDAIAAAEALLGDAL